MLISTLSFKTQYCVFMNSEDLDKITHEHLPALAVGLLGDEYVRADGQVTPFWGLPSAKERERERKDLFVELEVLDGSVLIS